MEFLDISSLRTTYRYAVKMSRNLNRRSGSLDLQISHKKSREKETPTHRENDKSRMDLLRTTNPSCKQRRVMGR
jgi:hypothetical protein